MPLPTVTKSNFETGLGKGIQATSNDEKHRIQIRFRTQPRATQSFNFDESNDTNNFLIRRTRIAVKGGLYNDEWLFNLQFGFADSDLENDSRNNLRDANVTYNKNRDLKFSFGQMKIPFSRQRWNSSSALQMVDRSSISAELNLDRDVGAMFYSEDLFGQKRKFAYYIGVFGGNGRNRIDVKMPGVLTVGRIIYSPFGGMSKTGSDNDWLSESDLNRYQEPKISFGFSGAYNKNSNRALSTHGALYDFARFDYSHATADIYFKWMGFSLQTEALWRKANSGYMEREVSGTYKREYSRSGQGYFVQIGYLFSNNYELITRFGEFKPLGETDPNLIYSREVGGGLSYYFAEHNLKWQIDYFRYTGIPQGLDGDHVVRTQMQVFY
ncbi:MAG: porin [Leptospira sp.]|nr:porin [Leptospira sp.]